MKRLCRDSPISSHTVFGKEGSSSVIGEVEEMMISVRTREKFSFLCVLISVMILAILIIHLHLSQVTVIVKRSCP